MHKLVLLRHGESQWNRENRFTGWRDVPLSEKGVGEAREAGRRLKARLGSGACQTRGGTRSGAEPESLQPEDRPESLTRGGAKGEPPWLRP